MFTLTPDPVIKMKAIGDDSVYNVNLAGLLMVSIKP